jgi:recombination protein RecR
MTAFEELQQILKRLPGLGYRSAERIALDLVLENRERGEALLAVLGRSLECSQSCSDCGNLCEGGLCDICRDDSRDQRLLCIVERVPDLRSMERAGAYRGLYHVLHGKLSPLQGVGPESLNLDTLGQRLGEGRIEEVILALSNDVEGEATCHFLQDEIISRAGLEASRIGFGLPSGGGIPFADPTTLRSALEARRHFN